MANEELPGLDNLSENDEWREIIASASARIKCDRYHVCGNQARWALITDHTPFAYVCSRHRAVYDATKTFWKDGSK